MKESTNVPYIKTYDENGKVNNFPNGGIKNDGTNRQNRKERKFRFLNNSKSFSMVTVKEQFKEKVYKKLIQTETDKEGKRKTIEHYILKTQ
jgi:Tol biopolymer transport system component